MNAVFRIPSLALLVLALAIGVSCSDSAPVAGISVQLAWQSARLSKGHQTHVVKQHMACVQCHELKADSVGVASPARCATCHQKETGIVHAQAQAAQRFGEAVKADCTTCHAFAPSDGAGIELGQPVLHENFTPAQCIRCHATRQGNIPAVMVHGSSDCLSCHRPHEDGAPKPGQCADCHKDIATTHASLHKSAVQVCTTCHQHQHAPASEALGTCATCHAIEQPIVPASALFEKGHTQCVGCHQPHQFGKAAAVACRSCHTTIHVMGEVSVQAHAECTSCHSPHDVRGSPEKACANCHANVHPDHPKLGAQGTCTGCHDPHPAAAKALVTTLACSSCHKTAHSDKGFHLGVACTQCHQPHAFALTASGTGLCRNCHAQETNRVAVRSGHQVCASCHTGLPHDPASPIGGCVTCHASEQHAVRKGHGQCLNCHEPHGGAQSVTCQSCHVAEAHSAPAGHAKCANCHEPHTGSTTAAPACATCHAVEATSKHGQIAGSCANCHRAHGPKGLAAPPVCTTCHQVSSLTGLHQVQQHQACTNCHGGHGDRPNLARDACLTCHTDRNTHFPGARCASCHLFDTQRVKAP